jgi:hypothetical protein
MNIPVTNCMEVYRFKQTGKFKHNTYVQDISDRPVRVRGPVDDELKTVLAEFYAITMMYKRVIREYRGKKNLQKEFDDAISGYMDDQPKLAEVIYKQLGVRCTNLHDDAKRAEPLVGTTILLCEGNVIKHQYKNGFWLVLSSYADRVAYLLTKTNTRSAVLIAITYFNMRSHSGTNWSPLESYPDLFADKYADYTKFECFASLFNNQNYLTGKDIVDHIFTKNACDKAVPGVAGSWPADVWPLLTGDKQMLLVNPVYSETIIEEACDNVYRMWQKYPGLVFRMTLPIWDDMYGDIFAKFREMGCTITRITHPTMRNHKFNVKMSLSIYVIAN